MIILSNHKEVVEQTLFLSFRKWHVLLSSCIYGTVDFVFIVSACVHLSDGKLKVQKSCRRFYIALHGQWWKSSSRNLIDLTMQNVLIQWYHRDTLPWTSVRGRRVMTVMWDLWLYGAAVRHVCVG